MRKRTVSNSKFLIILLLLGICLRTVEMDSFFSWTSVTKEADADTSQNGIQAMGVMCEHEIVSGEMFVVEMNRETLQSSHSFTTLRNSKKIYDRGIQRYILYLDTVDVYMQNLNDVSVTISKEAFQELRNDLVIVDFIHQKDGKKSEEVAA